MHFQRVTAFAIAVALAMPLSAFTERRTPQRTTSAQAVVDIMNIDRAQYGLRPLRINAKLSAAAVDRINDMFRYRYFNHVSPSGLEPWTWVERRGYRYRMIAENLAVGYRSADAVVDGWMHSPGHRANLLGRAFDEVGVAIAPGSPQRGYGGPTVVALYGER